MLDRVVREEVAEHIIFAGDDEGNIPLLREHLPAPWKKVIDILRLDVRTPEHEVLKETMEALRERNLQSGR